MGKWVHIFSGALRDGLHGMVTAPGEVRAPSGWRRYAGESHRAGAVAAASASLRPADGQEPFRTLSEAFPFTRSVPSLPGIGVVRYCDGYAVGNGVSIGGRSREHGGSP